MCNIATELCVRSGNLLLGCILNTYKEVDREGAHLYKFLDDRSPVRLHSLPCGIQAILWLGCSVQCMAVLIIIHTMPFYNITVIVETEWQNNVIEWHPWKKNDIYELLFLAITSI